MRTDTAAFEAYNKSPNKDPRYVIEQAFDDANTDLYYFTSHNDAALPAGALATKRIVESISGTSQKLSPDKGTSSIGNIQYSVIDPDNTIRDLFGNKLAAAKALRNKRTRVYMGYEGLAWDDYTLVATQLVRELRQKDGTFTLIDNDIQRQARKEIFDLAGTNLSQSINATQLLIPVYSVTGFELNPHGASYTDAPNQSVIYIRVEDEVIRCTGSTTDATLGLCFVANQRGALNTRATEHIVDPNASPDRRKKVEEYVYLEMPFVKLIYALLTGELYGQGTSLPTSWHLGISTDYVRLADFTGIGLDWWDPADDKQGFIARISGHEKTDGKKFIETQLCLLLGAYQPVYNDGALGLRRMTGVLSDASAVCELNTYNIVGYDDLTQDMKEVHNQVLISWNWDPIKKQYTRHDLMLDEYSINVYPGAPLKRLEFRALSGYAHTFEVIGERFDALRDRYAAPPYRLELTLTPDQNDIEVGDIVRVNLPQLEDYITKSPLNRAFEVQQVRINWLTGLVNVSLFASTQAAGPIVRHAETTVLADSFYSAAGTELSGYLNTNYPGSFTTIGNVGHIQANCTLTGNASLSNGIYYYLGDLTIDTSVIVNMTQNVQLRVMGHLTINGELNGAGAGLAPGGGNGFIGSTYSGGGIEGGEALVPLTSNLLVHVVHRSTVGAQATASNNVAPQLTLTNNLTTLAGIPNDLRGIPGIKGSDVTMNGSVVALGGAGGNGGPGLMIISRGASFGANGKVNSSGVLGNVGAVHNTPLPGYINCPITWNAGSGSGGHPGAIYFLIDGNGVTPTLSNIIADQPGTPRRAQALTSPGMIVQAELCSLKSIHSHYLGLSGIAHSSSVARIQFIPKSETAEADEELYPPDVKQISVMQNGEVVVIKWSAVIYDGRLGGYEIRHSPDTQNNWDNATPFTFETKGTNVTTADLPPGGLRIYIKAVDRINGNASINAASKKISVINFNDVIIQQREDPAWLGTLTGYHKHHTGVLIPLSTKNANEVTFEEQFQQFVPYPVAESIYEAPEIDIDFDDTVRVWADVISRLGYGKTGIADPQLEIDYRLEAGAYDGFAPWSSGLVKARHIKFRLVQDNTKGVAVVEQFHPTVDAQPKHDEGKNIDIAVGGTLVPFNIRFHEPPIVKLILNENADKNPVPAVVTTTGFTAYVYQSGADVGGAINYEANGE